MDPIPCTERLPATSAPVLAFASGEWNKMHCHRDEERGAYWECAQGDGWGVPRDVTHWMPLPPPPVAH
jgi:hypothetical protein